MDLINLLDSKIMDADAVLLKNIANPRMKEDAKVSCGISSYKIRC